MNGAPKQPETPVEHDLPRLEAAVERDMALLTRLPGAAPSPLRVAQIKAAVLRASVAEQRGARMRRLGRWASAAVAAGLLIATVRWALPGPPPPAVDAESAVVAWATALDQSARQLVSATNGWSAADESDLDNALHSLDTTFEQLDAL